METIQMRKVRVNSRKHVYLGKTKDGYLFVIRHLVPLKKRMGGFECLYKRKSVKICDNHFHVSEETFKVMIAIYFAKDEMRIPSSFDVILHYD